MKIAFESKIYAYIVSEEQSRERTQHIPLWQPLLHPDILRDVLQGFVLPLPEDALRYRSEGLQEGLRFVLG